MANVNNPDGLQPLMRNLYGGPIETELYSKLVGYAKAIRKHDAVTLLSTGYLGVAADITPGTTYYLGVALEYAPASTASDHNVIVSPGAMFHAQNDDSGTGFVLADRGQLANLLLTDGGTPTVEQSANQINHTGHDVTNTLDVKLLKLLGRPDNAYGAYSRWEIVFNKHILAPATAGI